MSRHAACGGFLLLVACGRWTPDAAPLAGTELVPGLPKVEFTLDRVDGSRFDFRRATSGVTTILAFGYTTCPDLCPVEMSRLARTLHSLSATMQRQIAVVFVTTDPVGDSAERLGQWLGQFDSRFIGLRGSPDEVARVEDQLALAHSSPPSAGGGNASHAARLLIFSPDDSLRLVYPSAFDELALARDLRQVTSRWAR